MAFKAVFVCALALMVQSIAVKSCYIPPTKPSCGCGSSGISSGSVIAPVVSRASSRPIIRAPASSINSNCVSIDIPQSGGSLAVTSVGPITPTGIAVATELGLAGELVVSGALPYLTAVAFEGDFATEGVVPVSYGCGDGSVGINEVIGGSAVSGRSGSVYQSGYASGSSCGCRY